MVGVTYKAVNNLGRNYITYSLRMTQQFFSISLLMFFLHLFFSLGPFG